MATIAQHTADIGGRPVFWRSAPSIGAAAPVLYLHGNPTSSDDWLGFLARTGGLAPDLPGFGRSGKRGDGDYTMGGYDRFVEEFLEHVGAERVQLLVHDWGSAGLLWAQRFPERVERVVVVNAVPLLPGYRWHPIARLWRTRIVGELLMGMTTRWSLGRASRRFNVAPGPMSADFLDRVWAHWDQGTQRAVLRLYRASPETALAAAGARLGAVTCPALVVWGERDPFIPPRFADAYAGALGGPVRVARLPDAGHWPWLDRPDVIDAVTAFFTGGELPAGFA
jgi:pimeloyl-ACP methyl ester carboxylesterase